MVSFAGLVGCYAVTFLGWGERDGAVIDCTMSGRFGDQLMRMLLLQVGHRKDSHISGKTVKYMICHDCLKTKKTHVFVYIARDGLKGM